MSIYSGTHFTVARAARSIRMSSISGRSVLIGFPGKLHAKSGSMVDTTAFRLQAYGHAGNEKGEIVYDTRRLPHGSICF